MGFKYCNIVACPLSIASVQNCLIPFPPFPPFLLSQGAGGIIQGSSAGAGPSRVQGSSQGQGPSQGQSQGGSQNQPLDLSTGSSQAEECPIEVCSCNEGKVELGFKTKRDARRYIECEIPVSLWYLYEPVFERRGGWFVRLRDAMRDVQPYDALALSLTIIYGLKNCPFHKKSKRDYSDAGNIDCSPFEDDEDEPEPTQPTVIKHDILRSASHEEIKNWRRQHHVRSRKLNDELKRKRETPNVASPSTNGIVIPFF